MSVAALDLPQVDYAAATDPYRRPPAIPSPLAMIDLRISRSPSLRAAHQRGFDARLRGVSRYSSPYEERPGWAGAYYRAWMTGWEIADAFALPADTVNVDDDYPEDAT